MSSPASSTATPPTLLAVPNVSEGRNPGVVAAIGQAITGDNGSAVPFDTPCSATFLGNRVLVANQSAVAGDASHQAILDVEVGEPGLPAYLPKTATF